MRVEDQDMRWTLVIRAASLVVAFAVVSGGVVIWRSFQGHPAKTVSAKVPATANTPKAKPTHVVVNLPENAPKIGNDLDPDVIYPFAKRLAEVNSLARKMIVTNAEYHDNDAGMRYFTAVVTSCKDLNELWPQTRGVLDAKIEGPLRLKTDFATFAFVEYYSQGQWGLSPCDST